ncbi:MAG: T9SS type A sorting domain-containing protein, partial [Bacteroidetes bacterium]|nr:T9SS type A sorting domain-containing protein [Bacteroidota bacterium]
AGPYVRKLLRSLDGGQTWDSLTMAPGTYTIGRIDADGSGPAIGSNASAFLRTRDFWQTAEVQDELYGHNTWEIQFLDADNGWVTTNRAILRTTNGGVNWTKATPVLPSSPRIVSTWPQPATSGSAMNTIIDLTQPGSARLELYDLLGRRRAVLFDGHSDATRRTVSWSAGGVEAGVYVLRLVVRDAVVWKTFVKR